MNHLLTFDPALLARYDKSGPRYTSYPTAAQFHAGFTETDYLRWAARTNAETPPRPLSLYLHLPYCDTVCYYCACNKIITRNRAHAQPYLEDLFREIALQGALFDRARTVEQLHWGGGTPTFFSPEQMRALMRETRRHFRLRDDDQGEYSIEIDPRRADAVTMAVLREIGFNRMSVGVQDFDPVVQQAVNRVQSAAQTREVIEAARAQGFRSINVDLIYGLPHQNAERFARTLDTVLGLAPDRLSVFNYAHLPELFKTQRQIDASALPGAQEKLAILQLTIERLTQAGYVYIGMDHFARPDDELAVAQRQGTLYRNFQGYSTHADCDLVAMGITAISKIGDSYSQNVRTVEEYGALLAQGRAPVMRGVELSADDLVRCAVIMGLICHYELDIPAIEQRHGVIFRDYFAPELEALGGMQADGLVEVDAASIRVQPAGKLLIRNVCMVFDRYLARPSAQRYSKVI